MARVVLGAGKDYPSSATGINAALGDGHRWLVFADPQVPMDVPVNLDSFPHGNQLRLEGGAPHVTELVRQHASSPLIYSFSSLWRLNFTGLHFNGNNQVPAYHTSWPSCEFRNVQMSFFENCAFTDAFGPGLSLGAGAGNQADTLRFF